MAEETILILDAEENVTWTLKTLLENEGYSAVIINSIKRALRDFTELNVSGLITEYWVGSFRTLGAIRKLKEIFPETYVMMLTDKEIREDEYEEIMQAGVDDYFLKPIPIRKILLHLQKGLKYRGLLIEKDHQPKPYTAQMERKENEDHP
jgi:DNA-binding NtrC family response regulator